MKLQIDFDNKIIRTEEKVNLGEFFSKIEELFPDLKWREFDLQGNTVVYWYNPVSYPYYPIITYDIAGDPIYTITGTYNIEIK